MSLSQTQRSESLELFRGLLRIDTTNPPGNEHLAAQLVADTLAQEGIEPRQVQSGPNRTSVVARIKGDGSGPPLLLTGHLDVVEADAARWKHPPFGAVIDDGWLYGRGAVDMKHMVAMSVMVLKLLKREGVTLKRDLVLAAVADEEAGCDMGSRYLVDHYPELVRAEFALGEIGGFTQDLNGRRLYPIQVAQKGVVWVKARAEGTPGHGSMPREDNALLKLSSALARLSPGALPLHPTPAARRFIEGMAKTQALAARLALPLLLNPALSDRLLAALPDKGAARAINAILRNTAVPTVVRAGSKTNVIPAVAEAEIDGRTVPGQSTEDFLRELGAVLGEDIKLEVLRALEPVEVSPDTKLYALLADAVREMDPEGTPVPYIIPGFTDAAPFAKLGITFYGFAPIWFPPTPKVTFSELYHGDNERIPVEGFHKGLSTLYSVVRRWCTT